MDRLLYAFVLFVSTHELACAISNIQIHSEDGRQHFIELNLKQVEVDVGPCLGCTANSDENLVLGGSYQQWTSSPPTFTVVFTPGEIVLECEKDMHLPYGICARVASQDGSTCSSSGSSCSMDDVEDLAEIIEKEHLIPMATGDAALDHRVAVAIVLLNMGHSDQAIDEFTSVLNNMPTAGVAYFGKGVALARKLLQNVSMAQQAVSALTRAIELDVAHTRPDIFIHRAEILLKMQNLQGAYSDVTTALKLKSEPKFYFLRGIINLLMENFDGAEKDFRQNLECSDQKIKSLSHFHLGLALFYRGRVRNAVEVFKEVLKDNPDHVEASLSLAQGFKELGNTRAALSRFNHTLQLHPDHVTVYSLRGNMKYDIGDPKAALSDFEKCLQLDSANSKCHYLQAASKIMLGQFYDGVKETTKLMISNNPVMRASPEHIKAHYLREYARYVHSRLDSSISSIQPDADFNPEYLNYWVRLRKFDLANYKEQPGLQPGIRDINQLTEIPASVKILVCWAENLGKLSQVSVDGIVANKRVNLAMGLASIHIAQYFESKWKELKLKTSAHKKVVHGWRDLFDIAVFYRRLASLDQPFLWVSSLPDYKTKDGYRINIPFVRGSTMNTGLMLYFDLAFKLTRTMLEHYSGDGAIVYPELKEDIIKATTCQDLLDIAKRRKINPHGFLVSTQVPSFLHGKEDYRIDGGFLVLSHDLSQRTVFALNIASSPDRTSAYSAEMNHLLKLLQEEIKKSGSGKNVDMENVISNILSIMYYFYNLSPLTKGSSAVAYSVVMGLLLSLGWQITGRIPNGRLLDLEAMLAGAPDAFVTVVNSWMSIRKTNLNLSELPRVWESFPTIGSVLEILAFNNTLC